MECQVCFSMILVPPESPYCPLHTQAFIVHAGREMIPSCAVRYTVPK